MRTAVVIQHNEPEGPAAIADAFARHDVAVTIVRADLDHPIPTDLRGVAALVVMGGPMSATSDEGYPTRRAELAVVGHALEQGIPVLGVCLGAQLLALAAGGTVVPGHGPEIGWAPIDLLAEAATDPLLEDLPDAITVLHWHGETYTLPPGAVRLARSAAYDQQAFRVGSDAWGLQFHLEVDEPAVVAFADAFPEDTTSIPGGRSALLAEAPGALVRLAPDRDRILDRFAARAARAARAAPVNPRR